MDEIMVDEIISFMLDLSGYPDFFVAIKLYKKPDIGHSEAFLFI